MNHLLILLSAFIYGGSSFGFSLKKTCPPSFELRDRECHLASLYQLYSSPHGKGVGSLRTALPQHRGGYSPEQIDLGRYLFFDPILSKDKSMSCASCHKPELGFSDGMPRSTGLNGELLPRSAPSLWNVGFLKKLFWDARSSSLETQAKGPLFHPNELGHNAEALTTSLASHKAYRELFEQAFPKMQSITIDQVTTALAAFQSSLISLNSRYDRYAHGYSHALTEPELKGLNIFRSFVARCAECHTPPLFTNQQIAVIGVPPPEDLPFDIGAEKTFQKPMLRGGFKVPSLRNIAHTAPYMHAGQFKTLHEAVRFYTSGRGHAVPEGERLYIHWHIWEPQLSDIEIDRLVDFLKTLSDETFMPEIPQRVPSGLPIGNRKVSH
ncbi:cytochrome-c peroxidase [Pseudobacteriovorax antillogorgiicola]|uniref:Methylamine utilization protein MauG n=1 Tax=Pseudobacteriovorax antillogorgiicola TaxID=1513793 RepID=A0A1Y6CNJ8_9BACT|nr:cytochrome c peroxidase [Pseudobacteriovorax antillogorgiicola]TCS43633.1 cytochrome c peroxidase [Pseudobacteriovorax antillogorgiicola]SMF79985.1 cytochrome c peroxidase [Pseudobacteriovorax antillogorgiicola]